MFGVDSRWFSEFAGTAMIETSADAVQAGHVVRVDGRQRVVAAGKARLAVTGPKLLGPGAKPEHDERGVGDREDGLGGLLKPALPAQPTEEQDDPALRRDTGRRPDQVRARIGRDPARLAVEEDRRTRRERPGPLDVIGDRVVDGHDRVGPIDPAALPEAIYGQDRLGHLAVVVRVEDDVDDVVHDTTGPAPLPGVGGQVVGDRNREDPERVIEVGRGQLAAEGCPPATHRKRPEGGLAESIEQERGDPSRAPRRGRALRTLGPAEPPARRHVAPDQDVAVAIHEKCVVGGEGGDLDLPTRRSQTAGDTQTARIGRRRVGHEEHGAAGRDGVPAHRLTTAAP